MRYAKIFLILITLALLTACGTKEKEPMTETVENN